MIDTKKIEEVVQSITNALPPGLVQMQEDAETVSYTHLTLPTIYSV